MSYWMMILMASGAMLALGLLFVLLVMALDAEAPDSAAPQAEPRWTTLI